MKKELYCSKCGNRLKHYDSVTRLIRTKNRETRKIRVERLQCRYCCEIHRRLPNYIFPYKQYDSEIIKGVLEGIITCETLGYEDYPCEMTMMPCGDGTYKTCYDCPYFDNGKPLAMKCGKGFDITDVLVGLYMNKPEN